MRVATAFKRMLHFAGASIKDVAFGSDGVVVTVRSHAPRSGWPARAAAHAACRSRSTAPGAGGVWISVAATSSASCGGSTALAAAISTRRCHGPGTTRSSPAPSRVDEIAVGKHRYLTVVVCHDTGRLAWAHPGKDRRPRRSSWICWENAASSFSWSPATALSGSRGRSPSGARTRVIGLDPWHILKAATGALDEIRREVWNEARKAGQKQLAKQFKGARFALWKSPGNLTERQQQKLAEIQQLNKRLHRAYLLSQQLREIYRVPAEQGLDLLEAWLK